MEELKQLVSLIIKDIDIEETTLTTQLKSGVANWDVYQYNLGSIRALGYIRECAKHRLKAMLKGDMDD